MPKRKYANLKVLLPEIQEMLAQGKSHREIEEHFGLTGELQISHRIRTKISAKSILSKEESGDRENPSAVMRMERCKDHRGRNLS